MKITNYREKITPFAGFNFCFKLFNDSGLPQLIDLCLGKRTNKFGFDYSDIFSNHMAIFLHGGDCTEDINEHLRGHLQSVKGFKSCSADTVLRGIKELSTQTDEIQSESKVWHQFNINKKPNGLMAKSLLLTGTGTNDDTGDLFGMELAYNNDLGTGNANTTSPALDLRQYNGNISATKWSVNAGLGSLKQMAYNYKYDPMNRLQAATH